VSYPDFLFQLEIYINARKTHTNQTHVTYTVHSAQNFVHFQKSHCGLQSFHRKLGRALITSKMNMLSEGSMQGIHNKEALTGSLQSLKGMSVCVLMCSHTCGGDISTCVLSESVWPCSLKS